jgi:hypothetical protein
MPSGNVWATRRRHGIAPNLFYRWKDEVKQGTKVSLWGEALPRAGYREGPSYPTFGAKTGAEVAGDRILKTSWGMSCVQFTSRRERWWHRAAGHTGGGNVGHRPVEFALPEADGAARADRANSEQTA